MEAVKARAQQSQEAWKMHRMAEANKAFSLSALNQRCPTPEDLIVARTIPINRYRNIRYPAHLEPAHEKRRIKVLNACHGSGV